MQRAWREPFRGWTFTAGPLDRLQVEADDFIYAYPPYDVPLLPRA